MNNRAVACIIVNYRTPYVMLKQCLDSVASSLPGNEGIAIKYRLIIANNSPGDNVIEKIEADFPGVLIIEMGGNKGFAAGVNAGLACVTEPYVLLLNTDAVLTPGALPLMLDALEKAGDACAGVAPKMMSSVHANVIDAIGTVMPPDGASYNRGIGQCDLGQYDGEDEVFGTCFGATLLRSKLMRTESVGPLYEGYFLYFEDSDWCMRARGQGYRFITVPESVVYHMHSGVTRHETLSYKYWLIELNTLKIVVRTFDSPLQAVKIVASRCARLLARTFIRRKFIRENLSAMFSFARALPGLLRERRQIKQKRTVSDQEIFSFAESEGAYFDTVNYRPDRHLESLISSYELLRERQPDADTQQKLTILRELQQKTVAGMEPSLNEETLELIAGSSDCVRSFLRNLSPDAAAKT